MFPTHDDPRDPALEKLTVRLARDGQRLRDALDACPAGLVPDRLAQMLRSRAVAFSRRVATSHGAFAVRG